jgi:surface protein
MTIDELNTDPLPPYNTFITDNNIKLYINLYLNGDNMSLPIFLQNVPLGVWDVSNVTNMSEMFKGSTFNQDISNWNVSNVTNMQGMFSFSAFNGDISRWNVSNVRDMREMFFSSEFDQDISNWNVSNVTSMKKMFSFSNFNHPIGNWNVSNVVDMNRMFYLGHFNQNISNWVISPIVRTNIDRVFNRNTNISPENLPNHYLPSPIDSFSYLTDVTQIAPEPLSISLTPLSSIIELDGFDPIQYENVNVRQYLDTDPNNIVFKAQRAIYLSSKQDIQSRYGQQTEHIKFECLRVGSLAPTNINKTDVYLSMRAFGIASFLVPVQQINEVLRNPNIRVIEISEQPIKMLNAIVSQQMIEARVPNAVGADHCQDGTATGVHFLSVISLNPELVGGFKYFGLKQQLKKTRKLRGYMVKFKTKTSRNVSKNKNPRRGKNVRTFRKH